MNSLGLNFAKAYSQASTCFAQVGHRIGNSQVTQLVGQLGVAALFGYASYQTHNRSFSAFAVGFACLAAYRAKSNIKEFKYEASLIYTLGINRLKGANHWDTIIDNLILGGIPLGDDLTELADNNGVEAVLTLLEDFELKPTLFSPVQAKDWEDKGVEVRHLKAEDFNPVPQEMIEEGVAFIEKKRAEGKTVYVHCKAGRGRSATIIVCYLLKIKYSECLSVNDGINFVASKRSQISLNEGQRGAIREYHAKINPS